MFFIFHHSKPRYRRKKLYEDLFPVTVRSKTVKSGSNPELVQRRLSRDSHPLLVQRRLSRDTNPELVEDGFFQVEK